MLPIDVFVLLLRLSGVRLFCGSFFGYRLFCGRLAGFSLQPPCDVLQILRKASEDVRIRLITLLIVFRQPRLLCTQGNVIQCQAEADEL